VNEGRRTDLRQSHSISNPRNRKEHAMNANLTVSASNPSSFVTPATFRRASILPEIARSILAAVATSVARAADLLVCWRRRAADRQHLPTLDDGMLRDVGLSRADIETEAGKPFWRG
jgi:uncharacterized protein YjiS (DUF1127 family)